MPLVPDLCVWLYNPFKRLVGRDVNLFPLHLEQLGCAGTATPGDYICIVQYAVENLPHRLQYRLVLANRLQYFLPQPHLVDIGQMPRPSASFQPSLRPPLVADILDPGIGLAFERFFIFLLNTLNKLGFAVDVVLAVPSAA